MRGSTKPLRKNEGIIDSALTRKLSRLITLSSGEIEVLREFESAARPISQGREIITEGRKYDGLLILLEGVSLRYRMLQNGGRQVLNIVLPGDLIGFPACFFENALFSISALKGCVVSEVSFARFLGMFKTHPRLGAAIFWSFSCEAAMYAEHLIGVGRRSALERMAHFFLEMLERMHAIGLASERSYRLPLTQEILADALGLSVQYVNQTLRQLRTERLVTVERQHVTIENPDALAALADFKRGYISQFRLAEFDAENWLSTVVVGATTRDAP